MFSRSRMPSHSGLRVRKSRFSRIPTIAEKTMAGMPLGKTTGIGKGNSPSLSARLPPMPQMRTVAPMAS